MQNFLGTLSQFYDNATGLFGMPDISFSFVDIVGALRASFPSCFIIFCFGLKIRVRGICSKESS